MGDSPNNTHNYYRADTKYADTVLYYIIISNILVLCNAVANVNVRLLIVHIHKLNQIMEMKL